MPLYNKSKEDLLNMLLIYQKYIGKIPDNIDQLERQLLERKENYDNLKYSEELLKATLDCVPVSITMSSAIDEKFVYINNGFTKYTGYTWKDSIGKTSYDLSLFINPNDRNELRTDIQELGEVSNVQLNFKFKDGSKRVGLLSGKTAFIKNEPYIVTTVYDIDNYINVQEKLRKAENKLAQANKIRALGEMAGSIGHELKNYLMVINGYIDIMDSDPSSREVSYATLLEYLDKANKLATNLLNMGKPVTSNNLKAEIISPNNLIERSQSMLSHITKRNEVRYLLDPELNQVEINPKLLEQILINLIMNANQAIPEHGMITIRTHNEIVSDEIPDYRKSGDYVVISVIDDGIGMSPETQEKVFEPFFTTKGDQGYGLGLYVIYNIIRQHKGSIEVKSTYGQGSTFSVYLPSISKQSEKVQ